MRKLFVLFTLLATVGLFNQVQAQCTGAKSAKVEKKSCAATCAKTAAAKAASLDQEVESRTCAKSGTVSYVRKEVCPASGKVSYKAVEYCAKSGKFINVSPSEKATMKSCNKASGAKAVKASNTTKPACTAAQKAACAKKCTKGANAKATKVDTGAKAKLVKAEQ